MIVKKHFNEGRLILAICDEEIIGRKFEENKLHLYVNHDFYKGEKIKDEELKELVRRAYMVNIVGKKSIQFMIKNKIISKGSVIYIKKIPHAQMMVI